MRRLRVVIDAQIPCGGTAGGVEQFIAALVSGFSQLERDDLDLSIVVPRNSTQVAGLTFGQKSDHLRVVPGFVPGPEWFSRTANYLGPLADPLRPIWRAVRRRFLGRGPLPAGLIETSDFFENLGADVLHIAHQQYVRTTLPTIYTPHDLQHEHFPEFFNPADLANRRAVFRAGCQEARAVVADSRFVGLDIVERFAIDPSRVFTVAAATPLALTPIAPHTRQKSWRHSISLPDRFAFYPAQTWPHKNHIGLLRALALLRDRDGVRLDLVCTGIRNDFFHVIVSEVDRLRLHDQVRFLGYLPEYKLKEVYRSALFMVFPSLFEGAGLPVLEAFHLGLPVACSNVTSLPEYGGNAALLFDPRDDDAIATAMGRLLENEALRRDLVMSGQARSRLFTAEAMASAYWTIYRLAAGLPLGKKERHLLEQASLAASSRLT